MLKHLEFPGHGFAVWPDSSGHFTWVFRRKWTLEFPGHLAGTPPSPPSPPGFQAYSGMRLKTTVTLLSGDDMIRRICRSLGEATRIRVPVHYIHNGPVNVMLREPENESAMEVNSN